MLKTLAIGSFLVGAFCFIALQLRVGGSRLTPFSPELWQDLDPPSTRLGVIAIIAMLLFVVFAAAGAFTP